MAFNKGRSIFNCEPNCPRRKPGCQDHCERYLQQRAKHDALKAKEKMEMSLKHYSVEKSLNARDIIAKRKKSRKKYFGYND